MIIPTSKTRWISWECIIGAAVGRGEGGRGIEIVITRGGEDRVMIFTWGVRLLGRRTMGILMAVLDMILSGDSKIMLFNE
jgi:hypothetical protein